MNILGKKIRSLRKKQQITQKQLAQRLKLAESTVGMYERGERQPDYEILQKLADIFEVSTDYLFGRTDIPFSIDAYIKYINSDTSLSSTNQKNIKGLNEKDEKDIRKRIEKLKNDLQNTDRLMFSDEPLSEEAIESLLENMEYAIRQTQRINKIYSPHKLSDKDNAD